MNSQYFLPKVWEKVKDHLTPEQVADRKMSLYTMRITPELGQKLYDYISQEGLETYRQNRKNGRQVDFLYAPHFSVKRYKRYDGSYSSCYVDSGARGYSGGGSVSSQAQYEAKAARCMTQLDVYFAILKKYPQHLLDVSFGSVEAVFGSVDAPF